MIDVEFPLIEAQLKAIDQQLEQAITDLNWISEGALFIYYNDRYNHKEVLLLQEKMYTYTGKKAYHRGIWQILFAVVNLPYMCVPHTV